MTAHYLATSTFPVQSGDDVLLHAAAGGVGLLLTQVVKLRGGRIIATTSSDEKAELARRAGADEVIGYEGFAERVRELTGGEGVAVVYDGVGKATFDEGLASLRPRGTLVLYGAASGPVPSFDPMRLENAGSLYLTRPSLRHYTAKREQLLARASDCLRVDCCRQDRRANRWAVSARGCAQGARRSRRPADDRQAAAPGEVRGSRLRRLPLRASGPAGLKPRPWCDARDAPRREGRRQPSRTRAGSPRR